MSVLADEPGGTATNRPTQSKITGIYWDLSGLVQDCQLYLLVGYRVVNDARMPEWKPSAEFKAKREASFRQAAPGSR